MKPNAIFKIADLSAREWEADFLIRTSDAPGPTRLPVWKNKPPSRDTLTRTGRGAWQLSNNSRDIRKL